MRILQLIAIYIFMFFSVVSALAQMPKAKSDTEGKKTFIKPDVRAWKMIDHYTLADTIPVDTLTDGHQINNRIWKENVMNVTLGNLGSPYLSMYYLTKSRIQGNIFYNTIQDYVETPETYVYYNTKSPYTNLTYTMGYPKRRSEEYVHVLFTQNVNRRLNVGAQYKLSTSIGRYESQRADHTSVRLFSTFDGDYYRYQFNMVYNRSELYENGGILNDDYLLQHDKYESYKKADDIPVNSMDQRNRHATYQLHYAHQLDLGHVERQNPVDSSWFEVPVATAYHQIHLLRNHREYKVYQLANYKGKMAQTFSPVDTVPLNDFSQTRDSLRFSQVSNIFQLKVNEEFNNLFHFGFRAFIGNDIRRYHWPKASTFTIDELDRVTTHYHTNHETKVNSYLGGQIFKNRGQHFFLNAGVKYVFHGYNVNDLTLDGNVRTIFDIDSTQIELWAKGSFELRSPELWENEYCSNLYNWKADYDEKHSKTTTVSGGINIDRFRLNLTGFYSLQNSKIYFNEDVKPVQASKPVSVVGAHLYKHFSVIGFNSVIRAAVQYTSNDTIEPLPLFSIYSSNYYENLFFGVLTLQIGFDWRYNTSYFAPKYVPGIMQFATQTERKVGNYHYLDPFVNMQLKRARIYVKYEHVNSLWTKNYDYFHTIHYPANPGFFKFGVSWNFYD